MHPPSGVEEEGGAFPALAAHGPPHAPSALVEEDVMVMAEEDEVRQRGLAALGPVDPMMRLGEASVTPGKPAPAVPGIEGPPEGGTHRAGGGSEPHDLGGRRGRAALRHSFRHSLRHPL